MGRKKDIQHAPQRQAFELKPFCYYCDKEFDTVKTLIQHQRTKHCNCSECGLKFDTVTGLRVHMLNAYKKTLKEVPGAVPGRENPDIVVHGMEGIPKVVLDTRMQKAMAAHQEKQAGERAIRDAREAEQAEEAEREAERQKRDRSREKPPGPAKFDIKPSRPTAAVPPPEVLSPKPCEAPTMHLPKPVDIPPWQASIPREAPAPVMPPMAPAPQLAPVTMTGLSAPVKKLLAGEEDEVPSGSGLVSVEGLDTHLAPAALAGLHICALKVLACAGVLLPKEEAPAEPLEPGAGVLSLPLPAPPPTVPSVPSVGTLPPLPPMRTLSLMNDASTAPTGPSPIPSIPTVQPLSLAKEPTPHDDEGAKIQARLQSLKEAAMGLERIEPPEKRQKVGDVTAS